MPNYLFTVINFNLKIKFLNGFKSGIESLNDALRPGALVKLLTKEMKEKHLNASKELLERYEIEGEVFLIE
ncbi:hypothetical protein LAZ67_1007127 [Cordylochernes scorpioides]|uniref:Uncharacterized protein n=1 Tax=Cordylochernes scorpioides TaxID=51811 RepID=A0ABY6JZY6_9ARAC|nr:hypothetical protein LAZ67_1007127 [Cordylochernes scorpioides]